MAYLRKCMFFDDFKYLLHKSNLRLPNCVTKVKSFLPDVNNYFWRSSHMRAILSLFVFATLSFSFNANAQYQTSNTSCYAYTDCYSMNYYGQTYVSGRIYCQVYSSTYVYGAGATQNACYFTVSQGRSVQCSGFARTRDAYGNFVWGWQNYRYTCPGTY